MKVIIAGSRTINDYQIVKQAIEESMFEITEVVSGGANGVDKLGERWATENNIKITRFIPDWKIGKFAGALRNMDMARYAEALVLIWTGESSGSANMLKKATEYGLKIHQKITSPTLDKE